MTSIIWFRRDLRLADNPALNAAFATGSPVLAIYVFNDSSQSRMGAASCLWLHHSLEMLRESLLNIGVPLLLRRGDPATEIRKLALDAKAISLFWNRDYDPPAIAESKQVKDSLQGKLLCRSFNASLLVEPARFMNKAGKPFRVFTPFWKQLERSLADETLALPYKSWRQKEQPMGSDDVANLNLLSGHPWETKLKIHGRFGEPAAQRVFADFINAVLDHYPRDRDIPSVAGTSKLSPHLHFGEISVRQLWDCLAQQVASQEIAANQNAIYAWMRQLAWREFAHHLLFHFPTTIKSPLNPKFDNMIWLNDSDMLRRWQQGLTGYPIVDAGMRELWGTGWMHNRVRMVVASFLTKHLGISWLAGASWFWDTLFDADLANNTLGWQWVAGCGADAAPYYRIFNPNRQSERFDQNANYIQKWLPELASIEARLLHDPHKYNLYEVSNGHYPAPCVDHRSARIAALQRYEDIRS